jgi:hypothetical protein
VPYPPEEATLEHLRLLLQQLRPLLETRLVVMAQEVEHGLLEPMVLHFAKQRYGYLCWVLNNKTNLEIALRVCSSLAIDLKDIRQKEGATILHLQQSFLALFEEQGYRATQGLLWRAQENADLLPDFFSDTSE